MDFDLKVIKEAQLKPIEDVAKSLNLLEDEFIPYGKMMGKVDLKTFNRLKDKENGKLVLVTAITPTPAGEGKTTMSIALADGMKRNGKNVMVALREPSLGPVLGMKGGATGGGRAQVMPRENINLHFTGDFHAITAAHNFLSAAIDNHLYFGNELDLDKDNIVWPRTLDVNDRSLRKITTISRKDHFIITAASEIMAILSLATDLNDLKERLSNILIGYNLAGKPVFAGALKVSDALALLLRDAINPNLVQTLENTPVFIHGGPFANIAHGCNSVVATKLALKLADYTITEAGFGAELGAEKFLNIKTRIIDENPDVIVLVATIRALKYHGFEDQGKTNLEALKEGLKNIERHAKNVKQYDIPYIIAINHFATDTKEEIDYLIAWAEKENHPISFVDSFLKGSVGAVDLANKVVELAEHKNNFKHLYKLEDDLYTKVKTIAVKMYGASDVTYSAEAKEKLDHLNESYSNLPICIAKTPLSLSNSVKKRGSIYPFKLAISDARVSRGAGFVVVLTRGIITMPGLPKVPNAEKLTINLDGTLNGKL
jgi:formate--tetrahydrofolate ligase